jgi:hypothetical protein
MLSAFLLTGASDPLTIEMKGIEAVLVASTICVSNSSLLRGAAEKMEDGPSRRAVLEALDALEPAQEEHLEWAASMLHQLAATQVSSRAAQQVGAMAETVVGKVRDVLGR